MWGSFLNNCILYFKWKLLLIKIVGVFSKVIKYIEKSVIL